MTWFADLLRAEFEHAAIERGSEERAFRVANRTLVMRIAGNRWAAPFSKALQHLDLPQGAGGLTLHIWDGEIDARHHVLRAYLFTLTNWWFEYTGPRGQLLDVHSKHLPAFYDPLTGQLSVVDLDRNEAFLWKRDVSDLPYFEICAPARVVLHAWLKKQELQMIHAAAVGTSDGGVLLVGPGGSGKSTSALSCLDSGLRYLSDDYCIAERSRDGFQAHSLYGAAKLIGDEDFRRFPQWAGSVWNARRAPGEKAALFVNELLPAPADKMIGRFPIQAILIPQVTGLSGTTVESCAPREALQSLAPSTMSQMPASDAADLAFMADMVRALPCYRLLAGTDLARIPEAIAGILAPAAGARS